MTCKTCGKEIIKRKTESVKQYTERLYCCHVCYEISLNGKTKHGFHTNSSNPLYDAWRNIKRRCYGNYKNSKSYKNYGGRGITVCDEWKNGFEAFSKWSLDNGWEKGLSIDRTDNDGNYEPNNCRWITQKEQLLNRRNNVFITYRGKVKTLKEWSDELGLSPSALKKRLIKWDDVNRTIEEPIHESNIRYKAK